MIQNQTYWDNLTRDYGHFTAGEDKSQRFKSDFIFETLEVGMEILHGRLNTKSTILNLKVGHFDKYVEVFDRANKKNVDSSGKKKGVDTKSWYSMEDFNRTYKRVKKN